jgi:hypothetical protein
VLHPALVNLDPVPSSAPSADSAEPSSQPNSGPRWRFPQVPPRYWPVPNPVLHSSSRCWTAHLQAAAGGSGSGPSSGPAQASVSPSVAPSSGPQRFPSGSQLQPSLRGLEVRSSGGLALHPSESALPSSPTVARLPSAQLFELCSQMADPGRLQPLAPLPVRKSAPPVAAVYLPEQWLETVSSQLTL